MTDRRRPLVLITGAAGLLGGAVAAELADTCRVVGLDLAPPGPGWAGDAFQLADLALDESVEEALGHVREAHGRRVASVIHLAAHHDFSGQDSPLYEEINVNGTRRLMRALDRFDVEQVVYSSSLLVMRASETGALIDEDGSLEGDWPYPASKLEAEAALRESRGSIPLVILRLAGCYDDVCHCVPLAQQIRRIYERTFESLFFPGNPHHGQPFLHVRDAARCVRVAVGKRETLRNVNTYLVSEADVLSYGELQDRIGALLHGTEWSTIRVPPIVAKAGAWLRNKLGSETFVQPWMIDLADAHYPVSTRRAREELGFVATHRVRTSLRSMVAALKRDPRAWYADHDLPLPAFLPE